MNRWEVLSGLPAYGPPALNFSATGQGKHREGLVVRFTTESGDPWVGNFQPGMTGFCWVVQHPDKEHVIVVAGGEAYAVNTCTKTCVLTFGGQIMWAADIPESGLLLFASLTDVLAVRKTGIAWRSRRISWDGMRDMRIEGSWLIGEAYSPISHPSWRPFRVEVTTGRAEGGTYP